MVLRFNDEKVGTMETLKTCKKCGNTLPLNSTHFPIHKGCKDGFRSTCKECQKKYRAENYQKNKERAALQSKKRYEEKREEILKQQKEYYKKNKDKVLAKNKRWNEEFKEEREAYLKQYYQENKVKYRKRSRDWHRKFRKTPKGRLVNTLRARLSSVTRGLKNEETTKSLIGCSYEEFKHHIERQFQDGMTWDNYGVHGWHVDHIIPITKFDLSQEEHIKKCFHYSNLQPLWAKQNWSKSNKSMQQWLRESR